VFVVATANDVSKLPPEFLRKGRFDEMFFVDLPDALERAQIWDIVIKRHGRRPTDYDTVVLARACEQFTGAEIEAVFIDAMHEAYAEGKEPGAEGNPRGHDPHRAAGQPDGRPDRRPAPLGERAAPAKPPRRHRTEGRRLHRHLRLWPPRQHAEHRHQDHYPVSLAEATKVFDKLVASKLAKGYHYSAASAGEKTLPAIRRRGTRQRHPLPAAQRHRRIRTQRLLTDRRHCLQEKHDGRRLMVRKQGDTITGINRRGLVVAIPDAIREAIEHIPFDVLIDGEAVGDTLHAFDLLEVKGTACASAVTSTASPG
jgi:SpoVK/Ycf46/Vps4 family AAA+-type ATPase